MIIWIIQTIIFIILMCLLGFIIYLPYALIQMWVRSILYKMGFDCYTEQEKVTLGLIEKNRIEDLKNKIEVAKEDNIPLDDRVNTLYDKHFPQKKLSLKPNKDIKLIENKNSIDLKEIAKSLKELNKKYSK